MSIFSSFQRFHALLSKTQNSFEKNTFLGGFKMKVSLICVLILLSAVVNIAHADSNEPNYVKWSQPPVPWQEPNTYIGWDETSFLDQAFYAQWLMAGQPDCWTKACPHQCHGDADCATYGKAQLRVSTTDLEILRNCMGTSLPDFDYINGCACADFDRDGVVDQVDEAILLTWYGEPDVPCDCPEIFGPVLVADDFPCDSGRPVTAIRWWGSFKNWNDNVVPPENLPYAFYITIWTDVPAAEDANYSHPGRIVWENYSDTYDVNFFGYEFDPRIQQNDLAKFEFYQELEQKDYWYQPTDANSYWLGIMALYDAEPDYVWGWETRPHFYKEDAMRLFANPELDINYPSVMFEPVEYDSNSWDLSFELISNPKTSNDPNMDLGDAPDSSNNFGIPMTAYPGIKANYPTVYETGSPPYGPIHWYPHAVAYLGNSVSLEAEADIGPDSDGLNNIIPYLDLSDKDADDGVLNMPLDLPACGLITFDYLVSVVTPDVNLYVNVWLDWNRDGDWNDSSFSCYDSWSWMFPTTEWIVQNQLLTGLSVGTHQITSPSFTCDAKLWRVDLLHELKPVWMRITLSEQLYTGSGAGGSGPPEGYIFGETEDYYFTPPDCFPRDHPDYNDWVAVGKPYCWCYPRQCRGDATDFCYGKTPYCASIDDLEVLKAAWNNSHLWLPYICADFDHKPYGKFQYRVSIPDLQILKENWNVEHVDTPPDCFRDY